jgi:hypothetical protein
MTAWSNPLSRQQTLGVLQGTSSGCSGWRIGKPPPEKGFDLPGDHALQINNPIAFCKLVMAGPLLG